MPTITFTVEGPAGQKPMLRFVPRGSFTTPSGEIVNPRDSVRRVSASTNVQGSVVLPEGPWEVYGIAKTPMPFDVTTSANLKDLIVHNLPGNAPVTTLSQAVTAWMDANVNTEVTDTLITEALTDPESEPRQVLDDTYVRLDDYEPGGGGGLAVVDNGDGTATLTTTAGSSVSMVDNGNGTATITY